MGSSSNNEKQTPPELINNFSLVFIYEIHFPKNSVYLFKQIKTLTNSLNNNSYESLLQPENKSKLSGVLTYHVLAGKYDFNTISKAIKDGKGSVNMKTVAGGSLTFMMNGSHNISVKDENGGIANISTYDVLQSNGVIHVLDKVMLPKM